MNDASTRSTPSSDPPVHASAPGVMILHCGVQHYAWGTTDFIPALLGVAPDGRPNAELWMGAHPDLPATADVEGDAVPLDALIAASPDARLGHAAARVFDGKLPYLFKVLSAAAPLSIQAHPSKTRAEAGFARENAAGIPLAAKNRNYRDDNHKPELIVALTDFYGLRGFRPLGEIDRQLHDVPELEPLARDFAPTPTGLRALYERFMSGPQDAVDAIFDPLVARLQSAHAQREFTREDVEYWVLEADRHSSLHGHRDRGLLSVYLLNLVHLRPGEGMYLPAGILHAYLEGSGMEIMANSNNVLRGGLTPKHVDVPELIDNVIFDGGTTEIIHAIPTGTPGEWTYSTGASEFELRRIEITPDRSYQAGGDHPFEIGIVTDAATPVTVAADRAAVELRRGGVFAAPHGAGYTISAEADAIIYKGTVP